eukprot:gene10486-1924_t
MGTCGGKEGARNVPRRARVVPPRERAHDVPASWRDAVPGMCVRMEAPLPAGVAGDYKFHSAVGVGSKVLAVPFNAVRFLVVDLAADPPAVAEVPLPAGVVGGFKFG